jgi:hypothetical protein
MSSRPVGAESGTFSLVQGGPLFHLWRRTHLSGDDLEWMRRRLVTLTLVAWLPLLVLSVAEGHAWGRGVQLTFLRDMETHVRLLIALPLLILAELIVHQRLRPLVAQFSNRGLIRDAAKSKFDAALASAGSLRNSITAELLLLALVYGVGVLFVWRTQVALDMTSWYGEGLAGELRPSWAGWWLGCVSLPLFQFLLLRWYYRLFIWARFLWQVSRLELNIMPLHPDRCGGLGFLAMSASAFSPVLFAQGALLAGVLAGRIFYAGAKLTEFKLEPIGLAAIVLLTVLGPLLAFTPKLAAAKRVGLREAGALAQVYVRTFDHKWLRGGAPAEEPLIGSSDIQSLADLGNSLTVVREMRVAPFTMQTVLQLVVSTLLPVAPLLVTMIPLEELLKRLLKVVF